MPNKNNSVDNPWRRLPWTVSLSLIVWVGLLWGFGFLINTTLPKHPPPMTKSIDMRLIEIKMADAAPPAATPSPVRIKNPKPQKTQQHRMIKDKPTKLAINDNASEQKDNATSTTFAYSGENDNNSGSQHVKIEHPNRVSLF
ncbi:MAG: hypothetical protein HQK98_05680 [Nitrospirae bacterium]|nr:hypothetical protein [Nitrospirota bacterium]